MARAVLRSLTLAARLEWSVANHQQAGCKMSLKTRLRMTTGE